MRTGPADRSGQVTCQKQRVKNSGQVPRTGPGQVTCPQKNADRSRGQVRTGDLSADRSRTGPGQLSPHIGHLVICHHIGHLGHLSGGQMTCQGQDRPGQVIWDTCPTPPSLFGWGQRCRGYMLGPHGPTSNIKCMKMMGRMRYKKIHFLVGLSGSSPLGTLHW